MRFRSLPLLLSLSVALLGGCNPSGDGQAQAASQAAPPTQPASSEKPSEIQEIEWDALIPEGWRPDTLMEQYNADDLADDDPRAQELMEKLQALWRESPVVPTLEGRRVKLPGFVVPLEMDEKRIHEFLLVPYYGACIHVPPPPANQTVHVVSGGENAFEGELFDTVWVTGTLRVEATSSELAEAGYRLEDVRVAPYE